MHFKDLKLEPRLLRGLIERGYTETTAVQEKTLAVTLTGSDASVQSQTGTGKTAAFLITIFDRLYRKDPLTQRKGLIITPTRELAVQIEKEAGLLNRYLGLTVGCFYGGVGYARQLNMLQKGVDIVIGTPGRLLDLSQKGFLRLKQINILVIDEADRLFDMGFLPDLREIFRRLPPRHARQSMLFSATLNRLSRQVAAEYMNDPVLIELSPERMTVDTISQELYHVLSHIKLNLLLGILKKDAPRNALIFTNMRRVASRLAGQLRQNRYPCRHLTGDLPQKERLKVIKDFTEGRFPFLVATDVAARGLHIDGLEMVINYDLPQDSENYVHRIGRTARAGNSGKAVSLACEKFSSNLEAIESFLGVKIPVQNVSEDLFATDRSLQFEAVSRGRRNHLHKNRRARRY